MSHLDPFSMYEDVTCNQEIPRSSWCFWVDSTCRAQLSFLCTCSSPHSASRVHSATFKLRSSQIYTSPNNWFQGSFTTTHHFFKTSHIWFSHNYIYIHILSYNMRVSCPFLSPFLEYCNPQCLRICSMASFDVHGMSRCNHQGWPTSTT